MLTEQSLIRYLPWKETSYWKWTRGFPDQNVFKICMMSKSSQLLSTLIIQILVIANSDAYLFTTNDSNSITLALVILYLISSTVIFVLFSISIGIRFQVREVAVIEETKAKQTDSETNSETQNPIQDIELTNFNRSIIEKRLTNIEDQLVILPRIQESIALLSQRKGENEN